MKSVSTKVTIQQDLTRWGSGAVKSDLSAAELSGGGPEVGFC